MFLFVECLVTVDRSLAWGVWRQNVTTQGIDTSKYLEIGSKKFEFDEILPIAHFSSTV
jgi:hypothetical protein